MTQDVIAAGAPSPGDPGSGDDIPPLVHLASDHTEVEPGQAVRIDVTVSNPSGQVESYDLTVLGPAAPWVTISPQTLSLFPGEDGTATLTIRPPMSSSVVAGTYFVGVRAMSHVSRERSASAELVVAVEPFYRFTTAISRSTFAVRTKAKTQVRVINQGNSTVTYSLAAYDPDGYLRISLPQSTVTLVPGEAHWVPILAKMAPRPFGTANDIRTVITSVTPLRNADTDAAIIDEQPSEQRINILHRPFIRLRFGLFARLVLIFGLLALVAAFAFSRFMANQAPATIGAPPVPSGFLAALTTDDTPVLTWKTSPGATGYTIYSVAQSPDAPAPAPAAPPAAVVPAPAVAPAALTGDAVFLLAADTSPSPEPVDLADRPLPVCEGCTEVTSVDAGTTRYVVETFTPGTNCWRIAATVGETQSLYSPEACIDVPEAAPALAAVDTDGDGTPDSVDTNGDGVPDAPAVDTDGDGTPDAAGAPAPVVAPCPPTKLKVKPVSPTALAVLWKPAVEPPPGMTTPDDAAASGVDGGDLKMKQRSASRPALLTPVSWTGGSITRTADSSSSAAEAPAPDPTVCDPAKKITGWTVQRKIFSGWSDVSPEPKADDTAIEVSGLDPDRRYCFRMSAKAADANSVYTEKICARTPALPEPAPSSSPGETFDNANPSSTATPAPSATEPTPAPAPSASTN